MNTVCRTHFLTGTLCVLTALLAGCSAGSGNGFGDAGKQSPDDPRAVITAIGHVPAADGTLRVRSGAEVVLSSKDSDGVDSAVLSATWTALNAAAQGVKMLERGASAMSFRAPLPTGNDPLELRFGLTVRTADGDSNSSEVRVLVDRVRDPDDFLLTDLSTSTESVNLAVVAAGYQTVSIPQNIPFQISIQKQVRYKRAIEVGPNPSTGAAAGDPVYCASLDSKLCVKIGPPVLLSGSWLRDAGVEGLLSPTNTSQPDILAGSIRNPRFRVRLPSLNADEVNFAVLSGGTSNNGTGVPPGDARRNNLLYVVDIGDAQAEYAITLTPDPALAGSLGTRTLLVVYAADSTLSPNPLRAVAANATTGIGGVAATTITRDAALLGARSSGVVESATTASAYYEAIDPAPSRRDTLDKWLRDNCFQPSLAGRPGHYGADIHSTYLNDRDLGFGREMYFKTSCTTEQLGATGATINTNAGERASIVFNYPSLEAAIKRSGSFLAVAMEYRADAAGGAKYTRFYTFAPDPRTGSWKRVLSANFDGRGERYTPGNCTVCHGGKPRASYPAVAGSGDLGATFVPWDINALLFADTDPSVLDERVKPGFRRADQEPHLKALNLQGVVPIINSRKSDTNPSGEILARWDAVLELINGWYPAGGSNYGYVPTGWQTGTPTAGGPAPSALYSGVIAENCRMCHMQRIVDSSGSLTVASAPQFKSFTDAQGTDAFARLQQRVFEQHLMPASRLTSDRFWIPQGDNSQSSAQLLAAHLGLAAPALPVLRAAGELVNPLQVTIDPTETGPVPVRLTGLGSRFASTYTWTLTTKPAASEAVLVGANTAEPALRADATGNYVISLTVRDASGNEDVLDQPVTFTVDRRPRGNLYSASWNYGGTPVSIDLVSVAGAIRGDGTNTFVLDPAAPAPAGLAASIAGSTLTFTPLTGGTISYVVTDADGDFARGSVQVTVVTPGAWFPNAAFTCNAASSYCASLTPAVDTRLLAANRLGLTTQEFDSQGYSVTAGITAPPQQPGKLRSASNASAPETVGAVSVSATSIAYRAPSGFVSFQTPTGTAIPDTFKYRLSIYRNSAFIEQSSEATASMTVDVRQRWSAVLGVLQSPSNTCRSSGCHFSAPDAATGRAWGDLMTGPLSNPVTTNGDLAYSQLMANACPGSPAVPETLTTIGTLYCINLSAPQNSLLYLKPQVPFASNSPYATLGHSGSNGSTSLLNTTQLNTILEWIRDGAWKN